MAAILKQSKWRVGPKISNVNFLSLYHGGGGGGSNEQ